MRHTRNALWSLCGAIGIAASAQAFPAFTDGDFGSSGSGTLNSWAGDGVVQTRAVDDPINGGALPADAPEVFDTALAPYFTTGPFAVLGDASGRIADAPDSGLHILARGFVLPPGGAPYDLDIRYRTAFDGHASVPEEVACDAFVARLNGPDDFFQVLSTTMLCNGDPQQNQLDFQLVVPDLPAGSYDIWFTLLEGGAPDTLNTAAGVDSVTIEVTGTAVACDDGLDNDGDTLVDLLDPGCANVGDPSEQDPAAICDDGLDNDGDTLIDLLDPGCANVSDPSEQDPAAICDDGLDNDGDTLVDLLDPGCANVGDPSEQDPAAICDDGLDNDGDTLTDLADPGCEDVADETERNPEIECDDGLDNDTDLQIDWPADTDCTSATDDSEAPPQPPEVPALPPLGVALLAAALLGAGLSAGSRRRRR
jgi:hypothetical protein